MKCVTSLFLLIFIQIFTINASNAAENFVDKDQGAHLYKNINKVNNNFYTAKISNQNLWLVMERIHKRNQPLWLKYINAQSNSRAVTRVGKTGTTGDGSLHAKMVLEEISYENCEVWVAYITKDKLPREIPPHMYSYEPRNIDTQDIEFAKNIEMFVTVTSTPHALITSHMGIAASAEGVRSGTRTKGTSVDLHSFAAKVMLMRNPMRKYMINAPVFVMEKIIVDAIPHSVFVGTREMREIMLKNQHVTFEDFKKKYEGDILESVRRKAEENRAQFQGYLVDDIYKGRRKKEEIIKEYSKKQLPLVKMKDGEFLVSDEAINLEAQKELERQFEVCKNPFPFNEPGNDDRTTRTERFLKFMEQHPPILSVNKGFQDSHPDFIRNIRPKQNIIENFSIFDPENPSTVWLSVNKDNKDYSWMFTNPFQPAGETHFIAVKLDDLANAKLVEPM